MTVKIKTHKIKDVIRIGECRGFKVKIFLSNYEGTLDEEASDSYFDDTDFKDTEDEFIAQRIELINKKDLILYSHYPYKTQRYFKLIESLNKNRKFSTKSSFSIVQDI